MAKHVSELVTTRTGLSVPNAFSLTWLHAVDPRIFTPITWEHGRDTTIRLRAADNSIRVNVARLISQYIDGTKEISDEVYTLGRNETEAGDKEISQFRFTFDSQGKLDGYDPEVQLSEHMQGIVMSLGSLVTIPGSTIRAINYTRGAESDYVSDGTQWVDARSATPIAALPGQFELTPGRPA